ARHVTIGRSRVAVPSIEAIIEAVNSRLSTLVPKDFDGGAFVDTLAQAYTAVAPSGGQAAIFDVYRMFVMLSQPPRFWRNPKPEGFAMIDLDQFRARLSKALESDVRSAFDGRTLRLLPPLNPKDGLFVFQPAEGRFGFVGRLEFVPG